MRKSAVALDSELGYIRNMRHRSKVVIAVSGFGIFVLLLAAHFSEGGTFGGAIGMIVGIYLSAGIIYGLWITAQTVIKTLNHDKNEKNQSSDH